MSTTIMVWTPVSISGCHLAGWGMPHRRSTSGKSRARAPQARRVSKKREGVASPRALASSTQTRSGTRASTSPAATMARIRSRVSAATLKPRSAKRAAKRARRRMRTGSSAKAGETWRRTLASMSARPP